MNKENKLPTAEEELMDAENTLFRHVSKVYNLSDVIDAMEEHTRLHTAPLREELEQTKEQVLLRHNAYLECQKEIDLLKYTYNELFDSYKFDKEAYEKELENLKTENERFKNIISGYESSLKDYDVERKHLIDEQEKLREALERIIIEKEDSEQVSCEDIIENMVQIAENTLKSENK